MAGKISNSGKDENGRWIGGKPGDQSGKEWSLIAWYGPWYRCVLRHPDKEVRAMLSKISVKAALNNNIGYNQGNRLSYWKELKAVKYDPSAITNRCDDDCSAGVSANIKAVGYLLDIDKLKAFPESSTTHTMRASAKKAGFKVLTDSKYLRSSDNLEYGDILLNDAAHVAVWVDDGDSEGEINSNNNTGNDGSTTYTPVVPYTPATIGGVRTAEFSPQNMYAFVNIYIGDTLLTTNPPKPNMIQDFEVSRLQDAGSTFTFTVFDDNYDLLEATLAQYHDNIAIEYGYAGTNIKSQLFQMTLQDYTIAFNSTGVMLTISAISKSAYDNLSMKGNLSIGTVNPTEAVIKICEYMGWGVDPKNFDATQNVADRENPYEIVNDYPMTYILETIVPEALSVNGNIMTFRVDDNNVAYFKEFTSGASSNNAVKTYIYQKGYDSVVEDVTFDIKGIFGGTSVFNVATGLSTDYIDVVTKKEKSSNSNKNSNNRKEEGKATHTKSDQSIPAIDVAGASPTQANNKLYYYVKNVVGGTAYEAMLTIVGDPTINLLDDIRIINITDSGNLHHTSGVYNVLGITDSISEGRMTTVLKLVRTGDINEGVELLNSKLL